MDADDVEPAMSRGDEDPTRRRQRMALGGLLGGMAVLHGLQPRAFESMVPGWVPGSARFWNVASGAAEAASAGLLLRRRTSRAGGAAAFATLSVVYVANVQAVADGGMRGLPGWFGTRQAAVARLPLQLPLLWCAWRLARRPEDVGDDG